MTDSSSPNTPKRILVTGATGFVGRHLLDHLSAQSGDVEIVVLVRDRNAWDELDWTAKIPGVTFVEGRVEDTSTWADDPALDGLAGIFHLAAVVHHSRIGLGDMERINVEGTTNVVRLATEKGVRVVSMSTTGIVGCFKHSHEWADEHGPYRSQMTRRWPYYVSKMDAEKQSRALADELDTELVTIRAPILLGPGDHRFRSSGHVRRAMQGKLPFLIAGGTHFVDVRDAVEAIARAMDHPEPQSIYHLSGTSCSHDAFFRMVETACGTPPPKYHVPKRVAHAVAVAGQFAAERLPGDITSPLPDPVVVEMAACWWDVRSRYAATDLDFKSRNAQDTISDTVAWLEENDPELAGSTERVVSG